MKKIGNILIIILLVFVSIPLSVKAFSGGDEDSIQFYDSDAWAYAKAGEEFYAKINAKQDGAFNYAITRGSLPEGLTLSTEGVISGTVATDCVSGEYLIGIVGYDPLGTYGNGTFHITISVYDNSTLSINLDNRYTSSGRITVDYDDLVYQNGFSFYVSSEEELNGYFSYDLSTKAYNVVVTQDLNSYLTHYITLNFNSSEYNKLAKIEMIDSTGINPLFSDNIIIAANYCHDNPGFCEAYFSISANDSYSGSDRHVYFKVVNLENENDYYYVYYSIFNIDSYFAVFESNGGSHINSVEMALNTVITKPTNPTKDGYVFVGWYSDEALENEWDFDTTITANTVLYAKWAAAQTTFNTTDQNVQFVSSAPINSSYVLYVDNATTNYQDVDELIEDATTGEVLKVMDIYFKDNSNNVIAMTNGSYEVKVKIEADLLGYSSYRVGYVDPITHKITEWFDATIEDGNIVFNTTHLGEYAIVGIGETNPNTLDNIYIYIIIGSISLICLTGTIIIFKKINKK
ncbi:MAG TPA: InlB B-repeat-containing protein [Bacilli bacterium]|nr:InlB B-repeat-containing protein [Bacilli bacterium]